MSLESYLEGYAASIVEEWMRIVDLEGEHAPNNLPFQARATWHGSNEFELGDLGRFRLHVSVEKLPESPPIGLAGTADWVPATWMYVMLDDRVRLGESEAVVTASNTNVWHVDASDYWHLKTWEHTEVKVKLAHTGDAWLPWPPDSPVEIFMDDARRAAYVLQQTFPGTREV